MADPGAKPNPDELLSIGEVGEATGLSPHTIRVWERRYGRPAAVRLPSGHRRYTQDQVVWLRRIAEALANGHRPGKVLKLEEAELLTRLETMPIFQRLMPHQLQLVADRCTDVRFKQGDDVVTQGEKGNAFYIILKGTVNCIASEQVVATLNRCDYFGRVKTAGLNPPPPERGR